MNPMILFFDTETTGLPKDFSAPATDVENWPRLVSLSWITHSVGEHTENDFIIAPTTFVIPDEAAKIHGITQARAMDVGCFIHSVMPRFLRDLRRADQVIAHNFYFDQRIIDAECCRASAELWEPQWKWPDVQWPKSVCTMTGTVNLCKIPKSNGKGYKWPKLVELHRFLFGEDFDQQHTSMADTKALFRCYQELLRRGSFN